MTERRIRCPAPGCRDGWRHTPTFTGEAVTMCPRCGGDGAAPESRYREACGARGGDDGE